MSMLTSMCDRLRARAKTLCERGSLKNYFPTIHDATNDLESAAETIIDLQNRCHELRRDNEKLREIARCALVVLDRKRRNHRVGCTEVCPRWRFGTG